MQDREVQFQRLWHNKSPLSHRLQIHSESNIYVEVIRVNDKLPKLKPHSPLRHKTPTRSISSLRKIVEKSSEKDTARLKNSHELSFSQEDEFIPKVYLPEILKTPTPPKFQANLYTHSICKVSTNPHSKEFRNKSPIRSLNSVPRFQSLQNARSLLSSQNDKLSFGSRIQEANIKKTLQEKLCIKHGKVETKIRCIKCDIDYCPMCSAEHTFHKEEARRYPSVSDIAPLRNSLFGISSENDPSNYIREGTPSLAFGSTGSAFNETGRFLKESSRQLLPLVIYREDPHEYIDDSPIKLKGREDSGTSTESSESKSPSFTPPRKCYKQFSRHT